MSTVCARAVEVLVLNWCTADIRPMWCLRDLCVPPLKPPVISTKTFIGHKNYIKSNFQYADFYICIHIHITHYHGLYLGNFRGSNPKMHALHLYKPKTVGKYDQVQCHPKSKHPNIFSGYVSVRNRWDRLKNITPNRLKINAHRYHLNQTISQTQMLDMCELLTHYQINCKLIVTFTHLENPISSLKRRK